MTTVSFLADPPVLWGDLMRLEPLRALARLGARFEGVLRSWSPSRAPGEEDRPRDSAMFSVLAAEWPVTRAGLCARVGRPAPSLTSRIVAKFPNESLLIQASSGRAPYH
ncbi:MAG TPA: hypothetical protein VGJ19_21955 [Streptosporangiaceae bacterium]